MAWWIGVLLLAAVILSAVAVIVVVAHALSPETEAEKELKRLYVERRTMQSATQTAMQTTTQIKSDSGSDQAR